MAVSNDETAAIPKELFVSVFTHKDVKNMPIRTEGSYSMGYFFSDTRVIILSI